MTGECDGGGTPTHDGGPPEGGPEPAHVVAAMASAIERVRSMAKTVFDGDADLFANPGDDT
jgi:hypothetical protein